MIGGLELSDELHQVWSQKTVAANDYKEVDVILCGEASRRLSGLIPEILDSGLEV